MNNSILIGAAMTTVAVLIVGYFLHQQNERHFAETQRWFEVCKRQETRDKRQESASMKNMLDQQGYSLSDELRAQLRQGIDGIDADVLYSTCYKKWHSSN